MRWVVGSGESVRGSCVCKKCWLGADIRERWILCFSDLWLIFIECLFIMQIIVHEKLCVLSSPDFSFEIALICISNICALLIAFLPVLLSANHPCPHPHSHLPPSLSFSLPFTTEHCHQGQARLAASLAQSTRGRTHDHDSHVFL